MSWPRGLVDALPDSIDADGNSRPFLCFASARPTSLLEGWGSQTLHACAPLEARREIRIPERAYRQVVQRMAARPTASRMAIPARYGASGPST